VQVLARATELGQGQDWVAGLAQEELVPPLAQEPWAPLELVLAEQAVRAPADAVREQILPAWLRPLPQRRPGQHRLLPAPHDELRLTRHRPNHDL